MNEPSPRQLLAAAMRRQPTPRIPTMPQICHDTPVRIFAAEDGRDWIDGLKRCVEDPAAIYDYVIRLVEKVDCDGLRLFVKPEPMRVARQGDDLIVLDRRNGDRIGRIDTMGGGGFVPDCPPPPVETLAEVKTRLDAMVIEFTDEKMDILRQARQRVPHRFVASAPGGITMNTYTALRGRERAMIDFFDRPDFVLAVMDMQAEAVIQRAERLLPTGIDALYIGDPAASASLISPKHFERFCLPAYQKFCRHFAATDIPIYIHICGNSSPILEMMADTGAHVIEPLDPLGGVSVADAKRRVGGRVALMGGVNTLTLSGGAPQQVRQEAIQKCREGGPHGYILACGDMVPPETPLENLQALVDVAVHSQWQA
ncbi:MAG: uroporphyrinogen decarboxylase family protein [Chloroflexota bacterium]